jgi:hypothetical protein
VKRSGGFSSSLRILGETISQESQQAMSLAMIIENRETAPGFMVLPARPLVERIHHRYVFAEIVLIKLCGAVSLGPKRR